MFLNEPTSTDALAYLERDRAQTGYVMNLERAWAWRPDVAEAFALVRQQLLAGTSLTPREIALLVCTTARALGDPYCSLAWGTRLAGLRGASAVAEVLRGMDPAASTAREIALRRWAERIVSDPNSTNATDIQQMRMVGLSDREIFEATVHVAFRLAFSTVSGSLGTLPDHELVAAAPPPVRAEVPTGDRQPCSSSTPSGHRIPPQQETHSETQTTCIASAVLRARLARGRRNRSFVSSRSR